MFGWLYLLLLACTAGLKIDITAMKYGAALHL